MVPMPPAYGCRIFGTFFQSPLRLLSLSVAKIPNISSQRVLFRRKRFRFQTPGQGWTLVRGLPYWMSPTRRFAVFRAPRAGDFRIDFSKKIIDWNPRGDNPEELALAIASGRALGTSCLT